MKVFKHLLLVSAFWCGSNSGFAQTWTQTSAPITNWTAVASSADGTKLAAAASFGGIWVSTNSGASWMQTSAPMTFWASIASSADESRLVAGASHFAGPGTSGLLYISTDSGNTWIASNLPNEGWQSVASSADGGKLVALSGRGPFGGNVIFSSADSGATWVSTNAVDMNSVVTSADGTRLVVAGLGIWLSTNSGSSWTQTNSLAYSGMSVASSANGVKLMAVAGERIFVSADSGMTWSQTGAPVTNWIAVASSADGRRLVAVAGGSHSVRPPVVVNGPIYTSTDSGITWVSNCAPMKHWTCAASSSDGCKLVAAAIGNPSTNIPLTTVGGRIWISQIRPTPSMNIAPTNGNLTVSWIMPSTNFVMQQSPDLQNWADMTNQPVLNFTNLQNEVILAPPGSNVFYRLKTP